LEIVNPVLVGYSMGGRLALAFADEYQTEIKALVLESTAFGYKTKAEQEERILNDKKLAGLIEKVSLQEFFEYWYDLDLFKTLQKNKNISLEELRKEKIKINNKTGLVNSLIEFSTGKMKNYFDRIMNFRKKVFLITGKLDNKFTQIAIEAKNTFPFAEHRIVNNCGHNVHLEKPEEFLKFLNEFLLNVKENK
jgi:2-succinyl-6-hydroxy-2,4-cyclohexadiene-1-carboxylate synthase